MKKKRLYLLLGICFLFLLPSLSAYTADNYTNVTLTIPDGAYSADPYTNVTLIIGEEGPPANTPVITLNSPTSGSEITDNDSALLNVTVSNPNGTDMNVSFYYYNISNSSIYDVTGVANNSEVTFNWTGLTDGTYYWYANVTEANGNNTISDVWNFTIDRPYWATDNWTIYIYQFNFSIALPANGSFIDTNTDIPLNFTYENNFGVDDCVYNLTGTTTLTDVFVSGCDNTTFNAADGEYVLDVISNDTKGNSVTNQTNFTVDATLPQISIIHPTNTSYTDNVSQLVNITITDDNPHTTWYNWEGVNVTYTTEVNVTFQEGIITLIVYANDSAGNENSKNVTFFIDTLYPQIEIINPTATNYSYDNIRINISATDANLNTTWYNWNGTNITYTSEINITFDEGENTLTAYANDSYGNENSTNVTFRVDTIYPQISFGSGTAANDSFNCDKITVNVSLNETNFKNITYSLFNHSSGVVVNQTTYTSKILTLNWTISSSDDYDFNVTSCDNVGNCNSTETRTVTVGTCYDIDITLSNGITVFIWNVSNMTGTFQPLYQTSLLGILNVSNNESSTLDIIMKFNETSGLSNITVKANDVYNYSTAVTVEDSYVAIIEDLAAGDYNMIWMWADYNDSRRAWFPEMSVVGI